MTYDVDRIRAEFPALARSEGGRPVAWLDGPGGTQVPRAVIEATTRVYEDGVSNHGGPFQASRFGEEIESAARRAAADLLGADPDEVVFGQNMTSLTFAASRAIAAEWGPGDEIVVTTLDHDANVTPWVRAAAERGVDVVAVDFDPATGLLDPAAVGDAIGPRTRLVAVTAASNALGSVTDLAPIVAAAHDVGALVYVDAVHYSAHRLNDVAALGPDFLAASAYKFFGPHTGIMYGRKDHLERLAPYKVRPAPDVGPGRWETGTQSFESLAGVTAAVDHLASLGEGDDRRQRLESAFASIGAHEAALSQRFLAGLAEIPGATLYGVQNAGSDRVSTFAVDIAGVPAAEVSAALGADGVYVWDGHYYAIGVMERLGLLDSGGLVRIGFVHYTTADEVDRVLDGLQAVSAGA
jgi:cysteine desulfurase family protein (TIGR01976 family)